MQWKQTLHLTWAEWGGERGCCAMRLFIIRAYIISARLANIYIVRMFQVHTRLPVGCVDNPGSSRKKRNAHNERNNKAKYLLHRKMQ